MFFIITMIVCIWCLIEAVFAIFCGLTAPLFKLAGKAILWIIKKTIYAILFTIGITIGFLIGAIFGIIKAPIDLIMNKTSNSSNKKEASDANDYNYGFYQLDSYTQDLIRSARKDNFTCVHNGEELLHVKDFLA
ncbi:hypothetical protein [uncultured Campylobacter sp.]|uniref:hypothetical protein n=1 Tax=uncultured Campylobacter sp. TaxID=218934 RepID=UPI0026047735|nr:hypothetical protein [uncultured Campylobacter sp.]